MQLLGTHTWSQLLSVAFLAASCSSGFAGDSPIPSRPLRELESQEFRIRERAEQELVEWGRKNAEMAMLEFFKQSEQAMDPEVRERCLAVLRCLVSDEYMREGEGYIGVALAMRDDVVMVPGDPMPRNAVRVIEVRVNTPGQQSGILENDLIVGLEEKTWHGIEATPVFREMIRKMKPTSVARLTVLRNGELIELKVTLGRRPLMADMFFNGQNTDLEATERAAKEAYFQRWLSRQKPTR